MTRTQAPYGSSLAPTYDTVGSEGSVSSEIRDEEIILVDDMASRIFSERLQVSIRFCQAVDVPASTAFAAVITDLPTAHYRILGAYIASNGAVVGAAADFDHVGLFQRDVGGTPREFPLVLWVATGTLATVTMDSGAGPGPVGIFIPPVAMRYPTVSIGRGNVEGLAPSDGVRAIALRGTTAAFGAGARTITGIILIGHALPGVGQIRSEGLPFPSW